MRLLRLSNLAKADVEDILFHSQMMFGAAASRRYEVLIAQALHDIAADPDRIGVQRRDVLGSGIRAYHLVHSRHATRTKGGAVGNPRHLVIFRISGPDIIDVARILHDAMDPVRHLPPEEPRDA